jgi:hypothetical protein
MEEEIAEVVREFGWYAASIYDHDPPFLYSIGLLSTLAHPEFVVFGLESNNAHALLSGLIRDIRAGQSFALPGVHALNLGEDFRVALRLVHESQHPLYLGLAMGYCRHLGRIGQLQAVQVFWPDLSSKFPFDVGCDLDVYRLQPRLDVALTESEIRESERRWA